MLSQKLHITLPLLRSWAPRTLLLVCIGALSPSWVGIQAQDTLRTCRAQVTMITPEHSIKEVIAVVMRSYDVPDIALEQNDKVIRFTTTSNVQLDELSELTEGSGARIGALSCTNAITGITSHEGIPLMPIHIDTGDEVGDHARYEEAKALWIQLHPEEYERILRGEVPNHHGK